MSEKQDLEAGALCKIAKICGFEVPEFNCDIQNECYIDCLELYNEELQKIPKKVKMEIEKLKAEIAELKEIDTRLRNTTTQRIGENAELKNERSATLKLLRRLEWGDDGSGFLVCPCCDRAKGGGHAQDCELDAAIRKGNQT